MKSEHLSMIILGAIFIFLGIVGSIILRKKYNENGGNLSELGNKKPSELSYNELYKLTREKHRQMLKVYIPLLIGFVLGMILISVGYMQHLYSTIPQY